MAQKIDSNLERVISDEAMLVEYLQAGCKPKSLWRLGTEHEKFPYDYVRESLVPYNGARSIKRILESMGQHLGWDPLIDEGNIIGLSDPEQQGGVSLEPGGQFELSGAPLVNVHETWQELNDHLHVLYACAEPLGIDFFAAGANPLWPRHKIPAMPKSRYKIMTNYMPKVGSNGLDMMYRTATVQVNLDYGDEADMRRKMQLAMKIQPIVTGLFAFSPFTHGRPNGFLSWRSDIWRNTDKERCGILPFVFSEHFGFSDYVAWLLDVPMYFVVRDGHYYDVTDMSFRQFMQGKFKGRHKDYRPLLRDWVDHLSVVFPEVRLKQFLEMRGADTGLPPMICALTAFFAGLLYDDRALNDALELVKKWDYSVVFAMREAVPREGLHYKIGKYELWHFAQDLLTIAQAGLRERGFMNEMGEYESVYLAPLYEIVGRKQSNAEILLRRYEEAWHKDIKALFKEYSYRAFIR